MGMYDTGFIKCPHCGEEAEEQIKQFECMLQYFNLNKPQPLYLVSAFTGKWTCDECGKYFWVNHDLPKTIKLKTYKKEA